MTDLVHLLVDQPLPGVSRLTLNRPDKRNALNNQLRGELLAMLEQNDQNPDVRVTIVRGAGPAFCSGYDLSADNRQGQPYHSAGGLGQWPRHVVDGWFRIWDLAKPVIAQVHGYCLAGGSELATACDLVYVADDAQIGYPPVRLMSPPDMQFHPWTMGMRQAMESMLTGDSLSGREAAARKGWANRAHPADQLEAEVLALAERGWPSCPLNWRRSTSAACTGRWRSWACARPSAPAPTCRRWPSRPNQQGLHDALPARWRQSVSGLLSERDAPFGDYRERGT
jgi:enoyl-CoA hydratase